MRKTFLICILAILFSSKISSQTTLDISGEWNFQIDRNDIGESQKWYNKKLNDKILLPGSMAERLKGDDVNASTKWIGSLYDSTYYFNPYMEKYRKEGNIKFPFFLTPDKHYVGVAWYQKNIIIPANWKNNQVLLFLERAHIETTLWINGKKVGMQNSLSTPHVYDISSFIKPGKCNIAIRIDNRLDKINVGIDSHSVTDQTQGNWNGIVGRMELQSYPFAHFNDIQIYPNLKEKYATVKMNISVTDKSLLNKTLDIVLSAKSFNTDKKHIVPSIKNSIKITGTETELSVNLPMGKFLPWDEFDPALYNLTAEIKSGKKSICKNVEFGMREMTIKGKSFYVNGRKVMLRGTVENCDFPITGYPPMNQKDWERVFRICRNWGLNHMRFHSYCPPEAAFKAADVVGFYLQPEGPSWPNHGVKLGNGMPIDKYLMDETIAMDKEYGNHPSFCMLACGNEPSGRWVPWVSKFVDFWKNKDNRHLYTGASVGGGWQWQPKNQFHVKAGVRGLTWSKSRPENDSDFSNQLDTIKQPFVCHEAGQWCTFPNFDEIDKYTGVNKAKNFEIFRETLNDNNLGEMSHKFMMASGKLQSICYKYEIEKFLRTPDYAGFQLLALNDYSGQGTALVGLLDVFFDEKGYINADEFRKFCNETVPLARFPKFVYKNSERFTASIEISHYGKENINNAIVEYTLKDKYGKIYSKGTLPKQNIETGKLNKIGTVTIPLTMISDATELNFEVKVNGTNAVNDWNIWVYPSIDKIEKGNVYICDRLDEKAIDILNNGGNVLIDASESVTYGKDIVQYFTPAFWNTSWFKMRPPHTTGIYINNYHPLFKEFPSDNHSNIQWWELVNRAPVMLLDKFPADFQPIVQNIDTWFLSRKIGMLLEAKVLNGKLMMTTFDLNSDLGNRVAARQMKKAILDYMNSDSFRPKYTIDKNNILDMFTKFAPSIQNYTNESPQELKPKIE